MAYYDPYTDYGYGQQDYGYDQYGYGYGYEATPQEERPLPPPDKDWVDPVKVNRDYMKKIQKDCVQKEFQGLKEEGFYLLEVLVESVHLKKESADGLKQKVEGDQKLRVEEPFTTYVKFQNFTFMEVNGLEIAAKGKRTERVPSYTDLFQTVFTVKGRHKSTVMEEESDRLQTVGSTGNQEGIEKRKAKDIEEKKNVKKVDETMNDFNTLQVMRGKTTLIATTGLEMIQSLQRHEVRVRIDRRGLPIGTGSVRLPQTFRTAVLNASTADVVLPYLAVYSGLHTLDQDAGKVDLTIVLTCYGQAIVNSIQEVPDTNDFKFNNTTLWNRFKFLGSATAPGKTPVVHPKLALSVLKMGIPCDTRTSSQILQQCFTSNRVDIETPPRLKKCDWFNMANESLPKHLSTSRLDYERMEKQLAEDVAAMWRKHRQICRESRNQEKEDKLQSLYDRLEEVRMPGGDITERAMPADYCLVDTNSPFEEEAQKTIADIGALYSTVVSRDTPRKSSLKSHKK